MPFRTQRLVVIAAVFAVVALLLPEASRSGRVGSRDSTDRPTRERGGSAESAGDVLTATVPAETSTRDADPSRAHTLFAVVRPTNAVELDRALPAPAWRVGYVRIDRELVRGKHSPFWQKTGAGRIELPLPDDRVLAIAIEETTSLGPDRFTSTGRLVGRPASRASFAWNEGFLHLTVSDVELGRFALRAATLRVSGPAGCPTGERLRGVVGAREAEEGHARAARGLGGH